MPPDHARYREASGEVFEIFRAFTPLVEALSIDEAFLDVSGLRLHYHDAAAVGDAIRTRVRNDLDLPASVGVASNKLLAKLASEAAKPDGLRRVVAGSELAFLHPLGVRALWGVGEATYAALEGLGVATIGDLAALPEETIVRRLGEVMGRHLWELAWARDPRPVESGAGAKSISVEETFERDLADVAEIDQVLFRQSERLARRLRRAGLAGQTITLKIRLADFSTFTRSHTTDVAVDTTGEIVAAVRDLLGRLDLAGRRVRLLGVGSSGLVPGSAPRQMSLDGAARRDLVDAADEVRTRFGEDALGPARLLDAPPE